jgi:hypothetical protein
VNEGKTKTKNIFLLALPDQNNFMIQTLKTKFNIEVEANRESNAKAVRKTINLDWRDTVPSSSG